MTVQELFNAVEALLPKYRDAPVLSDDFLTPTKLRPDEDRVLLHMEPPS